MNANSTRVSEVPKNCEKRALFEKMSPLVIRIFAKKWKTRSAHTLPKRWIPLVHGPTPRTSQLEGPRTETNWTALVYVREVRWHRKMSISPLVRGRFCGEAQNQQRVDQKRVKKGKPSLFACLTRENLGGSPGAPKKSILVSKKKTCTIAPRHRSKSTPDSSPI